MNQSSPATLRFPDQLGPTASSSLPVAAAISNTSTMAQPPTLASADDSPSGEEEFCSKSGFVSTSTIITFTENCDLVLFTATLLSSLLQLYVLWAACAHISRRTTDKCMHVFLLSMTFADLLLTAICYPIELAPRAGLIHEFPRPLNATMHMLCWVALIVSSISLVFLNLDKLFYFRFPLRYSTYFTRVRAMAAVLVCWLLSSMFVVFAWLTNSFHCVDDNCVTLAIFPNRLHIYVPFMVFVGVFPTVTSLLVAIYIMRIVAAHRKQLTQERSLLFHPNSTTGTGGDASGGTPVKLKPNSVFRSRMRTFYFIFMTTVFTALTLLPYRVAGLARSLNPGGTHDCLTIFLFWVMMYMIYLNSIVNPLLTITVLPQYRIGLLRNVLCGRLFGKRHSEGDENTLHTFNRSESALPSRHRNSSIASPDGVNGAAGSIRKIINFHHPHLRPLKLAAPRRSSKDQSANGGGGRGRGRKHSQASTLATTILSGGSTRHALVRVKEEAEELDGGQVEGGGQPEEKKLLKLSARHSCMKKPSTTRVSGANGYLLPRNSVI